MMGMLLLMLLILHLHHHLLIHLLHVLLLLPECSVTCLWTDATMSLMGSLDRF